MAAEADTRSPPLGKRGVRGGFSGAIAILAILWFGASCPSSNQSKDPQLIVLSWDGAGDQIIDRLITEGRLPHLAQMAATGVAAEHSAASVPTKTAVSFASLWTGAWSDVHGITENSVLLQPRTRHTLLETMSGFSSKALQAEPVYITAARAGKRVAVLSATQAYPEEPHVENLRRAGVPNDRYLNFSGFEHEIVPAIRYDTSDVHPAGQGWDGVSFADGNLEIMIRAGGESLLKALIFDDPEDPVQGFDTVVMRHVTNGFEVRLKPKPAGDRLDSWSRPFPIRKGELEGNTFFRLFELAPDGSRLAIYQRKASALRGAHTEAQRAAYSEAYSGFHDTGYHAYRDGELGLQLALGGDGTAEKRMLEITAFDAELLKRGTRFALETWRPDVLFHYSQASDDAGHLWTGVLDPNNPSHDPELAAKLWPFYARIFEQLDDWLGTVRKLAPEAIIAVVSDHGMAGTDRYLYVNKALEEAGLLAQNGHAILIKSTRILAAESPFFLRVNDRGYKDGLVWPEDRDAVIAAAAEALLAIEDPQTGQPAITRLFYPKDFPDRGIQGVGDLYFDLAPGLYPKNGASPILFGPARSSWSEGNHGYWPERRDMHAIFYVAGPGVARGTAIPPIRHIDVAPTLAHLAGFPAPPQATGEVVDGVLR